MCLPVGVYLRETKRKNRDGSVVGYLQLAHSERHPDTGVPSAKVIHNFGRADSADSVDRVDRDALARLVRSICRFLEPEQALAAALAAAHAAEVEVLDSRRLGGAWMLDRLWERLGIGAALRTVATGRRLDGEAVLDFAALPAQAETRVAGLLLTVPDLLTLDRPALVTAAGYPSTARIPAVSYLLSLLALKLVGIRRVSHVEDLAADPGAALFAGLVAILIT
jgi:hypothetical protein